MRETIQDGALALLGETVNILNYNDIDYIIVGGWSPFLLNSTSFPHPGTKDIDILFKSGAESGSLNFLIEEFLKNGFTQSAKHSFQLLKSININGYEFMFNIDLLHPNSQEENPNLFVDHIDFPVKESHVISINYRGKTIVLPKSDFFFDGFYVKQKMEFELLNGEKKTIEFNLLDEGGLILSKTQSVFNKKRKRDAYDIFLSVTQVRDYEAMISKLRNISQKENNIKEAFEKLKESDSLALLKENIHEIFNDLRIHDIHDTDRTFKTFFKDLDIS